MTETIKPTFFVRELQKLDPSEEPGVCDVLAVREDGYRYSHDVYANHDQAEAAVAEFVNEGETADDWEVTNYPGSKSRPRRKPVMTEIQEVAEAIHTQYEDLWPLNWNAADFMARKLAGDQGETVVTRLTQELLTLNSSLPKAPPLPIKEPALSLLIRLGSTYDTLESMADGGLDLEFEMSAVKEATGLLDLIQSKLDGKEWEAADLDAIADYMRNHGIEIRGLGGETGMTAVELADKYAGEAGAWGQHPRFDRAEWRLEVCSEDTQLGYWDWVVSQIEQEAND